MVTEQLWWYVARAGGIVSLFLAGASVLWGLLLSTGYLERNPTKKWLLGLHRWLGGLTVTFTGLHVLGLWLDSYIQYSFADLFVPFFSGKEPGRWAIAWGVVSFHLLAAVQVTSLLMRRLPRRVWRAIHMSSFVLFFAGIVHGFMAGTDASNPAYIGGVVAMALATVFLSTYRVLTRRPKRRPVAVGAV
ncbi:MAG: ferric reductase-like transmembrane domain-containing protein [Acidimicrobiales bacterium]